MESAIIACLYEHVIHDLAVLICQYQAFAGVTTSEELDSGSLVRCLITLPDGRLVSAADSTIYIHDLATKTVQTLRGHTRAVLSMTSLTNNRLASGSSDATIRIWNLTTGTSHILMGHTDWVSALVMLPDERLASGSDDGTIRLWDLNMSKAHICEVRREGDLTITSSEVLRSHKYRVYALAVLPDGRLASGSADNTIRIWDLATGSSEVLRCPDWIRTLAVLPDGRLAAGCDDATVRVWDPITKTVQILQGHTDFIRCLCILPDGRLLSGSDDTTIRLWDLDMGNSQILAGHTSWVYTLTALPHNRVASSSRDTTIRIWE